MGLTKSFPFYTPPGTFILHTQWDICFYALVRQCVASSSSLTLTLYLCLVGLWLCLELPNTNKIRWDPYVHRVGLSFLHLVELLCYTSGDFILHTPRTHPRGLRFAHLDRSAFAYLVGHLFAYRWDMPCTTDGTFVLYIHGIFKYCCQWNGMVGMKLIWLFPDF